MIDYSCLRKRLSKSVFDEILDCAQRYQINTPLRLAHFLAQCAHESGGFKRVEENLNYSADGLLKVFKRHFNPVTAALYANAPESIASYVYASRMGNGTEASMDGWKYRGRGYIQLTGKNNYQRFDMVVPENIVENPDLIATKYPLFSAAWFWDLSRLNEIADHGSSENEVAAITKKINGGFNGLQERQVLFDKFYGLLVKEDKKMSTVTIELKDRTDGKIGIEIKVMDFDEKSNAIGLGQTIETFVQRMVESTREVEEEVADDPLLVESKPKLVMVK